MAKLHATRPCRLLSATIDYEETGWYDYQVG